MTSCCHEETYTTLPPTLEYLFESHPTLTPDMMLDRSIPRCKLCDLIAGNEREYEAVCPPPDFTSPIPGIRKHIELTEQLISEDIRREELEATLPMIRQRLEDEIKATDQRILEAWMVYWAIWGYGEGVERDDKYLAEEEVVEKKPVKKTPAKGKPKVELKIKGRAGRVGKTTGRNGKKV